MLSVEFQAPLVERVTDVSVLSSKSRVVPKPHVLDVSVLESSPAYVEESFPVTIDVRNDDSRAMDVWIDVLLYPTEDQSGEHDLDCCPV